MLQELTGVRVLVPNVVCHHGAQLVLSYVSMPVFNIKQKSWDDFGKYD